MQRRAGYTLGNRNVAIVGAGFVGASIAYAMALRDIAREIVIVNRTQVPIWSRATIGGIPIEEYCSDVGLKWDADVRKELAEKTKKMGSNIIAAKGRTHYGIATCVCQLADAIIN